MSNYIYEMDVSLLRIAYIMPKDWYCRYITTQLYNEYPHDRSDLNIMYEAYCRHNDCNENNYQTHSQVFKGKSLQEVVEEARKWAVLNSHSIVEKSPKDGTDSVVTG